MPLYTKNCVACGKPAIAWGGHIHTEKGIIITGMCQQHRGDPYTPSFYNGPGQLASCDSPNPKSCWGFKNSADIETCNPFLPLPFTDEEIAIGTC